MSSMDKCSHPVWPKAANSMICQVNTALFIVKIREREREREKLSK